MKVACKIVIHPQVIMDQVQSSEDTLTQAPGHSFSHQDPPPPRFQQSASAANNMALQTQIPEAAGRFLFPRPLGSAQLSEDLNQPFQMNSPSVNLSDGIWRSAINSSSLDTDMFREQPDNHEATHGRENSNKLMSGPAWMLPTTRLADIQQAPNLQADARLIKTVQNRYWSGTTISSSVSSQEDASARSSLSPELHYPISSTASSRHLQTSSSNSSSMFARRSPISLSREDRFADAYVETGSSTLHHLRSASWGDHYDMAKSDLSYQKDARGKSINFREQWQQIHDLNLSHGNDSAFQINMQASTSMQNNTNVEELMLSRQAGVSMTQNLQKDEPENQFFLHRSFNMMEQMPKEQQRIQSDTVVTLQRSDITQHGSEVPTRLPEAIEVQEPRPTVGADRPLTRSRSHDEAAISHMMAERRRRVKQKENFATLRRLVPIISKADKASTLTDAIIYLKDMQRTIEGLEAGKRDVEQRCQNLVNSCKILEKRNKELEAQLLLRGSSDLSGHQQY